MFPVSPGRPWETGAELDPGPKLAKLQRSLNMLVSGMRGLLPLEIGVRRDSCVCCSSMLLKPGAALIISIHEHSNWPGGLAWPFRVWPQRTLSVPSLNTPQRKLSVPTPGSHQSSLQAFTSLGLASCHSLFTECLFSS